MAYDEVRNVTVLFGGFDTDYDDETWEYNGTTWTKKSPSQKPSARYGHSMVYFSALQKIVLFGGLAADGRSAETWTYNGSNWTRLSPAQRPSARFNHSLVSNSIGNKVVLFGGNTSSVFDNETWEFNGMNWAEVTTETSPSERYSAVAAFDALRTRVVVFGGYADEEAYFADTWAYDQDTLAWFDITPLDPADSPTSRSDFAMVYDETNATDLIFGGYYEDTTTPDPKDYSFDYFDETYEWDFGTAVWVKLAPASAPSVRSRTAMVYDSGNSISLLFGGYYQQKTYNEGTHEWEVISTNFYNDTWTFDSATKEWAQASPATSPSARADHSLFYDSIRGKITLYGGIDSGGNRLTDLWEYDVDGDSWTEVTTTLVVTGDVVPDARSNSAVVYNTNDEYMYLFGGTTASGYNAETWLLDIGRWVDQTTEAYLPELYSFGYSCCEWPVVAAPWLLSATATDESTVRIVFDTTLIYSAHTLQSGNFSFVGASVITMATDATRIDDVTFDLSISGTMVNDGDYTVTVTDVMEPFGNHIDPAHDTATFKGIASEAPQLSLADFESSTKALVTFDLDMSVIGLDTKENYTITESPTLSGAVAMNGTNVLLTFDRDMQNNAALVLASNYVFSGPTVLTTSVVTRIDGAHVNLLTLESMTDGGTYTVTASNVESTEGIVIDPAYDNASYTYTDLAPRIVFSGTFLLDVTFSVSFDSAMNASTVENIANWTTTFPPDIWIVSIVHDDMTDTAQFTINKTYAWPLSYDVTATSSVESAAGYSIHPDFDTVSVTSSPPP
jgi:hypothetical protein